MPSSPADSQRDPETPSAAAVPSSGGREPALEVDAGRARLILRRPDKRNRIEPLDLSTVLSHIESVRARDDVRVVTVEAAGPVWCAGYHLGALAERSESRHGFDEMCDAIADLPMLTVAVLGGSVHGGGTDLAMSCDLRVAAAGISLAMPAARIGLQYYATGLQRFVERIGAAATKRIFLTAETIDADELLRIGYLTDLVPSDALDARVEELCDAARSLAPGAVRATKAAIDALAGPAPDLEAIQAGHVASTRSDEHREAMAALQERRSPSFDARRRD